MVLQTFYQLNNNKKYILDFELAIYGPLIIGISAIFCILDQLKLGEEALKFKMIIEEKLDLNIVILFYLIS